LGGVCVCVCAWPRPPSDGVRRSTRAHTTPRRTRHVTCAKGVGEAGDWRWVQRIHPAHAVLRADLGPETFADHVCVGKVAKPGEDTPPCSTRHKAHVGCRPVAAPRRAATHTHTRAARSASKRLAPPHRAHPPRDNPPQTCSRGGPPAAHMHGRGHSVSPQGCRACADRLLKIFPAATTMGLMASAFCAA